MMTFITVVDRQGNNLLNPSNEGSYMSNDIKFFHEIKGEMKEFFEGKINMLRSFRIDPPEFKRGDSTLKLVIEFDYRNNITLIHRKNKC